MVFDIYKIKGSDIEVIRQWLNCLGKAFEDQTTYCAEQPSDEYLQDLFNSDNFIALGAFQQQQLIGGLAAYELKKFEQHRSEVYIYDLAVDHLCRRQGVATALIEALKPIAREKGASVIYVQADSGDLPAMQLYSKLGVEEKVLHYDISVEKK